MAKTYLSAEELRSRYRYDPHTGDFIRLVTTSARFMAGTRVGHVGAYGYMFLAIDKKKYLAHRLVFLYMTGALPPNDVDHINGDRTDNRWENLRPVTRAVNLQNKRSARRDNKSGLLGVQQVNGSGSWRARVQLNGKLYNAGCFETPEKAHQAYLELKRKLHEGCTI